MNIIRRWLPYIFILALQPLIMANHACDSTAHCSCNTTCNTGKQYSCGSITVTVENELEFGKWLHIKCTKFLKNSTVFLHSLEGIDTNPHVDEFVLEYCQFTDLKLADIFHTMNITTVDAIKIINPHNNDNTNYYNFENLNFVKDLFIEDNTVKLSNNTFNDMPNLEVLYLHNPSLHNLTDNIFANLINLTKLELQSNQISELSSDIFGHNVKLSYLSIRYNNLTKLPPNLFTNLTSLKEVIMDYNNLTTLPKTLFKNDHNLEVLSLKGNRFQHLTRETFQNLTSLKTLDLSSNNIESLNGTLFGLLKNLRYLHLADNRLQSVNSTIFSPMKWISTVNLSRNYLRNLKFCSFREFEYLQIIDLSHNPFVNYDITQFLLHASQIYLQKLILQNISLTRMPSHWPTIPPALTMIDLRHNNVTSLKWKNLPFQFNEVKDLEIRLDDNNITQLFYNEDLESCINKTCTYQICEEGSIILKLKNNPITCDCSIFHLVQYVQQQSYRSNLPGFPVIVPIEAHCSEPESLRMTSLYKVKRHALVCPLNDIYPEENDKCPPKCSCQYRTEDNGIIVNCTGVGLEKFPDQLPNLDQSKTELWFADNKLKSLAELSKISPVPKVSVLTVSRNQLTEVHQLDKFDKLEILKLDNNNIEQLSNELIDNLRKSKYLKNLTMYNNPWKCNCSTQSFIDFIKDEAKYKHFNISLENIRCDGDGEQIYSLKDNFCAKDETQVIMILLYVLLAVVVILLVITTSFYFIFEYEIKVWMFSRNIFSKFAIKPDTDTHKIYDAFISVSIKDQTFIVDHLIPQLEKSDGHCYKLFIYSRDYLSGGWIANQIKNAIGDSSRTIFVLSKNYLEHEWARPDFRASHLNAIRQNSPRIIVILLDEVKIEDLDNESTPFAVKKTLKRGESLFLEKLKYELPHPPVHSKRNRSNETEMQTCRC